MASYLLEIQTVIPYLYQTHHLVGYDVEDKYVQSMVACIYQESFYPCVLLVDEHTDVVGHQES